MVNRFQEAIFVVVGVIMERSLESTMKFAISLNVLSRVLKISSR